ncbi:MAG: hypothetical protein B7Y88_13790 [Sphingomonadales bacterium 32-64-17]|nr:MAG: hypothetical protein B7Y88_13790 [Sphingomonadales bacterium 32-64-17]
MQKTDRLKFNPPLGRLPVLQYLVPGELQVDDSYQRQLDGASEALIRKIAQHWNWDLCQPLVVSRRSGGTLYVIDGQHRLKAALLRGDISQLPCQVVEYATPADEAASFVQLNQLRKALSKMELFKAAVASGDKESCAILGAMERAGLSIAPHYTSGSWKPGMVANIGGLQAAWRRNGAEVTYAAMRALRLAYGDEPLRYAGTIFPGIVAVCAHEMSGGRELLPDRFDGLVAMVRANSQQIWRERVNGARAHDANLNFARAAAKVMLDAWGALAIVAEIKAAPRDVPTKPAAPVRVRTNGCSVDRFEAREKGERRWCEQCDGLVSDAQITSCNSEFCTMRKAA